MNLAALKSIKVWIGLVVAIAGVLVAQGVVVEGSTISEVVGWVVALLGSGAAGGSAAALPAGEQA